MARVSVLLLGLLSVLFLSVPLGCARKQEGPPPLEVSFRRGPSSQGLTADIANTSSLGLDDVVVVVRRPDGTEPHTRRFYRLAAGQTEMVDARYLKGWAIRTGDRLSIRCSQYQEELELIASLPAKLSGEPRVSVSFRNSKVPFQGLVAGMTNNSDQQLTGLTVTVQDPQENDRRTYQIKGGIPPHDNVDVGFLELDQWKLKAGQKLTISCDQYQGQKQVEVTKPK